MRFLKSFFILLIIVAGLFAVGVIYFAGQVSAVYDPLKSYRYSLTRDELKVKLIQTIKSKSNLTFNLTDSTGTDKSDLDYYGDLLIKVGTEQFEYKIKYKKKNSFWDNDVKSEISLIGAFDKLHGTGGYQTGDKDIERLINVFENELIKELDGKNTSR